MGRDRSQFVLGLAVVLVLGALTAAAEGEDRRSYGNGAGDPGLTQRVQEAPPASSSAPSAVETERIPHRAFEVLAEILRGKGEPPPGYRGGDAFGNRERRLPPGRYREYDIHPWVRGRNRGPERIVVERRSGKAYYTADHYNTFLPMN